MKDLLSKERELRKKGFADKQIEETVGFLRQKGVGTVWDVQCVYPSLSTITKEMENITGSRLIIEIDPQESAKAMIDHIQKKRNELGI